MKTWETAEWIFIDQHEQSIDEYFDYTTSFVVEALQDIYLDISVYSQYAVYINGKFVNCGQYDDYEEYKVHDTLQITDFLTTGENQILVQQYVCGENFSTRRIQTPGIIFEVYTSNAVLVASGQDTLVRKNVRYRSNAEKISMQLGFNFEYDFTMLEQEFVPCRILKKTKQTFARPIEKCEIGEAEKWPIIAQGAFRECNASATKAIRSQQAYLSSCRKKEMLRETEHGVYFSLPDEKKADGTYFIFDAGGETTGLLSFSIEVPRDCDILISFGEHLDDLRIRSAVGNANFTFLYHAASGENSFFYPFQRIGLRYLQFLVCSTQGVIHRAGVRKMMYPLEYRNIPVQDGLRRMIWEIGRKTLHLCMHEHYEDCPWREQALYTMDSRVQMLCGYYAFGEFSFARASLQLMGRSLKTNGFLELCAPGKNDITIPCFTAIYVREVLEYVIYSGDVDLVRELIPILTKIVEEFEKRINHNGLLSQINGEWNFYEWQVDLSGDRKTGNLCDCLLNAFVSDAFRCYAEICSFLHDDRENHYRYLHQEMNKSMHQLFWREAFGGYATYIDDEKPTHDLVQAMMLYVDVVPKEYRSNVIELIKKQRLYPCTLSMTIFLYEALLQDSTDNIEYVNQSISLHWGRMLRTNTDTFWEIQHGAEAFGYMGSLCHGWSAVPIYIWGKYGEKSRNNEY